MRLLIAAAIVLVAGSAQAQHHQKQHGQSPYADMQSRAVKALSEQQIADLRAGRGMGMALPAELNGYPGPPHVLELADGIGLGGEQRDRVKALFEGMKQEAIVAGEKLIEAEKALDRAFRDRSITPDRLADLTAQVGRLQGELRAVHLKYHLTTAELLSPEQSQRYAELRGYR
jgi:Spy/CpxP family protein refolding chaperone